MIHRLSLVVNNADMLAKMAIAGFTDLANPKQKSLRPTSTAPGPGVPSVTMGKGLLSGSDITTPMGGVSSTSTGSRKGGVSKQANDATVPVLAGGLGGIGGWALGEKVLKPMIDNREASLAAEIAKQTQSVEQLKTLKPYLPLGASLVGAILLAGAVAAMANRRGGKAHPGVYAGVSYDPYGNSGYVANERQNLPW